MAPRYRMAKRGGMTPSNGLKARVFEVRDLLKAAGLHKYLSAMEAVDPGLTEHRPTLTEWFNGDGPVPEDGISLLQRVEEAARKAAESAPLPQPRAKRERPDMGLGRRLDEVFASLEAADVRQPVKAMSSVSTQVEASRVLVSRWKRGESRPTASDLALVEAVEDSSRRLLKL